MANDETHDLPMLELANSVARIGFTCPLEDTGVRGLLMLEKYLRVIQCEPELIAVVFSGMGHARRRARRDATIGLIGAGFEALLDAIDDIPIPTLAVVEGDLRDAGLDLALCCDFRIGIRGACAELPSATLGLCHHPGGLKRLVSRTGAPAAMKLLLTAQALDDEEMLRSGLIHELVNAAALQAKIDGYLEGLGRCHAGVVRDMKKSIRQIVWHRLDDFGARHAHMRSLR